VYADGAGRADREGGEEGSPSARFSLHNARLVALDVGHRGPLEVFVLDAATLAAGRLLLFSDGGDRSRNLTSKDLVNQLSGTLGADSSMSDPAGRCETASLLVANRLAAEMNCSALRRD
jgi:hypothetical protein